MISNILIILIGLTAFTHYKESRYALFCFSGLCGAMWLIDNAITESYYSYYYLLAALVDLLIIYVLSRIQHLNNTILKIQKACLMFIYLNLFGWIAYEMYIEPVFYDSLCAALFVAMLFVSINTGESNGLDNSTTYRHSIFIFGNNYSRILQMQVNKKTPRP